MKESKIKIHLRVYQSGNVDVDGVHFLKKDIPSILQLYPKKDFIIADIEPWCWMVSRETVNEVKKILNFRRKTK